MSLNDANGCRHRRRESKKEYHVSSGQIVKHCDNIIICSKNKINLLALFYEHWFHCFDLLPHNLTLVFASRSKDKRRVVCPSANKLHFPLMMMTTIC